MKYSRHSLPAHRLRASAAATASLCFSIAAAATATWQEHSTPPEIQKKAKYSWVRIFSNKIPTENRYKKNRKKNIFDHFQPQFSIFSGHLGTQNILSPGPEFVLATVAKV